ncbi:hypothetical protein JCM10450v2_004685 [Rhodotorula kratochvilovae]
MSNHTAQTGVHQGVDRTANPNANFKPDISTRIADAEQGNSIGSNPHAGNSHPSALEKAGGKLEYATGKLFGDGELQAKGLAEQGKARNADVQQDLATERGGDLSYKDRVPNN